MLNVKQSKVSKPPSSRTKVKSSSKASSTPKYNPTSASLDKALADISSTDKNQPPTTKTKSRPIASKSNTKASPVPQHEQRPQQLTDVLRPLASSEPSLRRGALTKLLTLLQQQTFTSTDLQQIWRALYVALYMHDSKSAVSVQNLARTLAGTLRTFYERDLPNGEANEDDEEEYDFPQSVAWANAFWAELANEWPVIDQWRMNKVLMLVRFWVSEGIAIVGEMTGVGLEEVTIPDDLRDNYIAEVVGLPLEATRKLPDGLRMHVLDVWGDELERLNQTDQEDEESGSKDSVEEEDQEERRRLVVAMLLMPVKELSIFRNGGSGDGDSVPNMPKNVRVRAKEVLKNHGAVFEPPYA
jgi:ribosomal RNA-processing protein 1